MSKNITVTTNDPKNPRHTLKIKGKVELFAYVKPARVRLHGTVGEEISVSVSITPTKKHPFKILNVRTENDKYFRHELTETGGDRPGWRLNFQNLRKEVGTYRSSVILETDNSVKPEIRIDVHGEVKQVNIATVSPRGVLLRGLADKPLSQQVRIVPKAKYPFEIAGIKADNGENIRYEMVEDTKDNQRRYVITVENQKKTTGRYFDILRVKTTSEIQPELKITVTGIIQAPRTMEN